MTTDHKRPGGSVSYVVSDKFDYNKMICDDAGPLYAQRHRWRLAELKELSNLDDSIVVIDNRVEPSEFAILEEYIQQHGSRPIYFKLIDVYWRSIEQPYYRFLFKIARHRNVRFLCPYVPAKITQLLCEISGQSDACVVVPYAYDSARELPSEAHRANRIAISGALGTAYPLRWRVHLATRRSFRTAGKVAKLRHPNYPDIGQVGVHSITGDRYIAHLAKFRFMLTTGAADREEFLKYSECGYAGCLPVGEVPQSFSEALAGCVMQIDATLPIAGQLSAIVRMSADEWQDRSTRYRKLLRVERDPERLQRLLRADHQNWSRAQRSCGPSAGSSHISILPGMRS